MGVKTTEEIHSMTLDLVETSTGEVERTAIVRFPERPTRRKCAKRFEGQGRVHGEFKEQCNVNTIMKKWRATGQVGHLNLRKPWYGDFTNATDYLEAVSRVESAQAAFESLPADVRSLCRNDPSEFMRRAVDPEQLAELEAAGLEVRNEPDPLTRVATDLRGLTSELQKQHQGGEKPVGDDKAPES